MRNASACGLAAVLLLLSASVAATEYHVRVGGQGYSDGYYYADLSFSPRQLTIQAGDTVVFDNAGGTHDVAADDGTFRCAQGCDGSGGNGDPSNAAWHASVRFDTPGTFGYHCEVHQAMGMTGTITVEGTAPAGFDMNQHGLAGSWANAATESQGLVVDVFPDLQSAGSGLLFGGWFTFDTHVAGGLRWYTVQGEVTDEDTATMAIYQTLGGRFDSAQPTSTRVVGEVSLHVDDCSHATLDYAFSDGSGRHGTIPLTRLLGNVACTPTGSTPGNPGNYLLGGIWTDPSTSGQGLVFDVNANQGVLFAAWYTYLADAAADAGAPAQHWYTLQAAVEPGFSTVDDVGIYESTGGVFDQHADTVTTRVGTARLVFASCTSLTMSYAFTAGPHAGLSGTLDLGRLAPVPPGCSL
ncbi:plastocyanin/azurin family copper-binding protein [Dokdonella sp.]|uniref:plastocyanin/azurin family copper-binding protein n=1 Tax=Dokdonella sp. TaxID=2291710 RepID=UPI002F429BBC